jgi:hypothetical protein
MMYRLAEADNATVNEDDTNVSIPVLVNDTFGGDGPSTGTITITTPPANGTASVDDNGTPNDPTDDEIVYTPNPDYNGADAIIYEICDANGDCDTAIVNITVAPVNDVPLAEADNATVNEDDTNVSIPVLVNDTFGGDGPSTGTITITTPPTNGTASVDDNGTPNDPTDDEIVYTPNPNYNGADAIIYEICDANGDCDTAIVNITVAPVNDVPLAEADNATVNEDDTNVSIPVLVNDTFGGDGPSTGTITITTPPTNGTASVDDNGTPNDPTDDEIVYTPNPDYNGSDAIIYEICDANGDCDTAIVNITVAPVNDVPLAEADNATVNEDDTNVSIPVLVNDTFGGDGPSTGTITITTPPTNGTASVDDNGTPNDPTDDEIVYTPNPNYNGADAIIYEICDANGDCDTAIVNITVAPVNDVPLAEADNATVNEDDTNVSIPVLVNDTFGGDGPSTGTITITTPPTNGTASVDDNGTPNDPTDDEIVYTPNPNYNGADAIIYEICDANGDCDTAIVNITVAPVNDVPLAEADNATVNEDDTNVSIPVLVNDTFGGDGPSTGTITITTPPANGTASVDDNGTPNDPTDDEIVYTPNPNYNGADAIIYEICDANGDCDTAIVNITVAPVNDVPLAEADNATVNEDDTNVSIPVLVNDTFGGDGPSTGTITITTPPANGTASVDDNGTPNDPTDDEIVYTPNPNYNGADAIIYEICDANGDCDTAIVNITVAPVNDVPLAEADNATVNEDDTNVSIPVLVNDTFGGDGPSTGTITITTPPANGTASVDDNGTPNDPTDDEIVYTPNADYNGADAIIYEICDANGDCDTAIVNITVAPVNDVPLAEADNATVNEDDTNVSIPVLVNDTFGGDGPSTGTITITTPPTNGTASVDDNGTPNDPTDDEIVYTPNPNYNGADAIIYEICDANGDCDTAIVNITVAPVNDVPLAEADNATVNEDDTNVSIPVLVNDTFGGDGPSTGTITITTPPANGTASVDDNGTPNDPTDDEIVYTPNADYNGADAIIYEICDANGDCDTAIVNITVAPVNDVPLAEADNATVNEDDTNVSIPVLVNDTFGGDGPSTGTITITTPPTNGTASVDDNGTPNDPTDDEIVYTPNADYNGADAIIYEICDANGDCDTAIVNITVAPVNDVPLAEADNATVNEDDTNVSIPVLVNDTFGGDGPSTGTITITTPPTNGTASVDDNGTPNDPTDDEIVYTPNANYNGADAIIYEICDANGDCDTAIVNITVAPVNDVPLAEADNATVNEDDTNVSIPVLVNDTFGGDGPSTGTITITTPPTNGTASVDDNGTPTDPTDDEIVYTPNPDYNGSDAIIYEICDANGDCDTAIVNITVAPVNDVPLAEADNATVNEDDTNVSIPVLVNDTFGGDGPSTGTITITTPPTNGTASVDDNGTPNDPTDDEIVYTPNANYNGADAIIYEICDANGDCDTAIVNITVNPVNDPPVVPDTTVTTPEDTPIEVCVPFTDVDTGDVHVASIGCGPTNGTITSGPTVNGNTVCVTYTPNTNYNGRDSICIVVCDNGGLCDTGVIIINIPPVNDPPVVPDTTVTTPEDTPIEVCVPFTDVDTGDVHVASIGCGPTNGTITSGPTVNGNTVCVTYTPNTNYNGRDSICIVVCDNGGLCDTGVIIINIPPVNDPPVVPDTTVTTPEDTPIEVCVPFTDVDTGDVHVASIGCGPSNGTITSGPTVNGNTVCVTYTPNTNYNGRDSICIVVCDNGGLCDTGVIYIDIPPVNDPPVVPDTTVTTPEDTPIEVCVPFTDVDTGDVHVASIGCGPTNGTITSGPTVNGNTVCVTYTPNTNYNGRDSICIVVCDNGGLCDTGVIYIDIPPVNDPPVVPDTTVTTPEDTPIEVCVPFTDVDTGDVHVASIGCGPSNGTITSGPTVNGNTVCVTYTPNTNYNGRDSICIVVCDNGGLCDTGVIIINIPPVNDPPVVPDTTVTTPEDTPIEVCVPFTDVDTGDVHVASIGCGPSNGTITSGPTVNGNTVCVTYTPNTNYNGRDSICIVVCDNGGLCDTGVIIINIPPVNDPPVVPDTTVTTPEDTPIEVCVPFTDVDTGDVHVASIGCGPSNGTITSGPTVNGNTVCVTYTPNTNYNGRDSICIVVCDNGGLCDTGVIYIDIPPVNDPPEVPDTTVTTPEDTPIEVCVPFTDVDTGDVHVASIGCGPSNGTITSGPTVNGNTVCVTYTPNTNYNGRDSICIVVCDNGGLCDTGVIYIDIPPVNDPPVVPDTTVTTPEDTPIEVCVPFTDVDTGDVHVASIGCGPSNGTITSGPTVNGNTVCVTYTPNTNYNGRDSICIVVCDNGGLCDTGVVIINIIPNIDTTRHEVPEFITDTICDITLPLGENIEIKSCDGSTTGTTVLGGTWSIDPLTTCLIYTAGPTKGNDTLCIVACDTLKQQCNTTTVIITVTGYPPVAVNDTTKTDPNVPVTIPVLVNDSTFDEDPITLCQDAIITQPGTWDSSCKSGWHAYVYTKWYVQWLR